MGNKGQGSIEFILITSFLVLMALALLTIAAGQTGIGLSQFVGQLGIHPNISHPEDIDLVRNHFDKDPGCQPGSPNYRAYHSDKLGKFLQTCTLEDGDIAIRVWSERGGAVYYEITGFFGKMKYLATMIIRDGYAEIVSNVIQ